MSGKSEAKAAEDEVKLAKALAHPVRVEILKMLGERPHAPTEVAERMVTPLSNVSYHFRTLLELDCIEPILTEAVRGSVKTTYRSNTALLIQQLCWNSVGASGMNNLLNRILQSTALRVSDALDAHTFEARDDVHASIQTVNVNEESWQEINALLGTVMDRVGEIVREEADVEPAGEARFPVTVSLLGFESPKLYEEAQPR